MIYTDTTDTIRVSYTTHIRYVDTFIFKIVKYDT